MTKWQNLGNSTAVRLVDNRVQLGAEWKNESTMSFNCLPILQTIRHMILFYHCCKTFCKEPWTAKQGLGGFESRSTRSEKSDLDLWV